MTSDDEGLLEHQKRDKQRMSGSMVVQAQHDVVHSTPQTDSLTVTISGSAIRDAFLIPLPQHIPLKLLPPRVLCSLLP